MFAGLGLAVALAMTPAGSTPPAAHSAANAVATQVAPTTDFERGLRAYAREEYVEAVRLFRLAASQGDAGAQVMLGIMYRDGQGVPQGFLEAARWFRLAAEQGHAPAQNRLGTMYANSWGVAQDDVEAVRWFRLAAEQGDALAQFNLGFSYSQGRGVTQNYAEAIRWYRLAAEQRLAGAQLSLGSLYANGQGAPQNYTEAIRWFRLAAEQGDSEAQFKLGFLYANGHGVPQNSAEAARWYQLAADQGDARAQYMIAMYSDGQGVPQAPAPPQPAASDTLETSAEEIEVGSIVDEEVDDVLRPGQSLFDVELRADCSVYYRRTLVQGRTEGEYGQDGNCELLPTIHRSPSGRWIAVHTPLNNYGFGQVAMVDTVAGRVAVPPRKLGEGDGLFPLNVWSPDESRLLMTEFSVHGPPLNDLYQSTVMVPCEFDIAAAALGCIDSDRFASILQSAALRASPLARCLSQRSCYLVMEISEPRFEAGEFAYTGTVQLKTLEAGASNPGGLSVSETFVPDEDIVWFQFSGRGPRSTAQDITLRVLDPLVEPNISRVQPEAPPPATASDLSLQPVQVACVRPGGRGGPITVTPGGQIMLGETPLFRGLFRGSNLTADYAFLVRPANSDYRLVLGSDGDSGPVEAAIVNGASMRVVHPGILGPGRVRGVAPAQNVVQFPGQCGSDGPYEPISWRSFGGGRYVAGISTPSEAVGALVIIDLQTGLWAQWEPSPATYPAPRRGLPAGETSADWMLFHAEPGRSQITAIDSQTGQITLSATFSFDCNPWQGARDGSNADLCLIGGIPDSNNEANNSPELLKSYNIRLQLGR